MSDLTDLLKQAKEIVVTQDKQIKQLKELVNMPLENTGQSYRKEHGEERRKRGGGTIVYSGPKNEKKEG